MDEWTIEPAPGGHFDVFHDRRPVAYDRVDLEEALMECRRRGATVVTVIEDDGYRNRVRV